MRHAGHSRSHLAARVALVGGAVPAPFVDADRDQLADVDALGRFVDTQGAPVAAAAPFTIAGDTATRDAQGRAATYSYVALDRTVIGALGRDAARLFDPSAGIALDLARGASALLGPRMMTSHAFTAGPFAYRGYDTTRSPLLDMTYGWTQLLRDPNIRDLLALGDTLLASHEPAAARLVEAAIGRLLAPGKPYLATQLDLLQKLTSADDAAVLVRLAAQMFSAYDPADPGVPAIGAIANAIGEVDRRRPGADLRAAWTKDDFGSVLTGVAAFLREQQRGVPRFIAIVKGRNP